MKTAREYQLVFRVDGVTRQKLIFKCGFKRRFFRSYSSECQTVFLSMMEDPCGN